MKTYRTRRATTDDLPQLIELWRAAHLPAEVLEKQFTEFQVAADDDGILVGAIALQIAGAHGRIHSETFADFGLADTLRPMLWERLQVVAQNHGLFRVWTQETAPWWKRDAGFTSPGDDVLQKLPGSFGSREGAWLLLQLKEERADPEFLEKEIQMFKEAEREKRETMERRGRIIHFVALAIAATVLFYALRELWYTWRHR